MGGIACAMSHRLALEALVKHPSAKWGLILEDDIAAVVPHAEEVIQRLSPFFQIVFSGMVWHVLELVYAMARK